MEPLNLPGRFARKLRHWGVLRPVHGRGRVLVACLHRVTDEAPPAFGPDAFMGLDTRLFRDLLATFSERFTPLALPEVMDRLAADRDLPEQGVVLTFDDGFADNLEMMLPLAEAAGFPITVFVNTGLVSGGRPHYEYRLADWLAERTEVTFGEHARALPDDAARRVAYREIRDRLHPLPQAEREARLDAVGVPATGGRPMLDIDGVVRLAASPLVTIGSHAAEHVPLPAEPSGEVAAGLRDAHQRLAEWTGVPPDLLSYPYGESNPQVRAAARDAGYHAAFGTRPRLLHRGLDPFDLPRVPFYGREVLGGATLESVTALSLEGRHRRA